MAAAAVAALLVGCSTDDPLVTAAAESDPSAPSAPSAPAAAEDGRVSGEDGSGLLPAAIAYAYEPDTRLTYRMEVNGTTDVEVDVPASLGESTSGRLEIVGETDLAYLIGPGPDDGTFEIRMTADFTELSVTGDLGDEVLPLPGLALGDLPAVDLTVIVDERGTILEYPSLGIEGLDDPLEEILAGLGLAESLDFSGLGANVNGPLGPVFPADRPLDVGSAWTDRTESRVGDLTIVTDYAHEVTDITELNGIEVVVVETTATVGGFEINLAEMMGAMLAGLENADAGEGLGGMDFEEAGGLLISALGGLQMSVKAAPAVTETTTWISLDRAADGLAAGIVRQAAARSSGTVTTEITVPDETGAGVAVTVRAEYAQDVRFTLTGTDRL